MTDAEIREKVVAAVVDIMGVEASTLTDETLFAGDVGADALDMVEIAMQVEDAIPGLVIDDCALDEIDTVGQMVAYVQRQTA
jgi:acyl carrier protein